MSGSQSESSFDTTGTYGSFVTVLVTNVLLGLGVFFAFWILRVIKSNRYFFAPLYYDQKGTSDPLPDPGRGLWSWIPPVLRFRDADLLAMRGLDSLMYAKFLKYMTVLFAAMVPIGCGVLIPLDATGNALDEQDGLAALSMANVSGSDHRLWAHAFFAVFCTFITFYTLYRLYSKYTTYRIQWMKEETAHNYTVMYKGVPKEMSQNSTALEIFSGFFPGEVVDAHIGVKAKGLRKLMKKWEKYERKLQFAQVALDEHGTRKMVRNKPIIGRKVEAIEFYHQKLNELSAQIELERANVINNEKRFSSVAFVTFKTIPLAQQRAALVMNADSRNFKPSLAPMPTDIAWKQLEISYPTRVIVKPITWVITGALIFFWGIITVFLQGIANLDNLSRVGGFQWLGRVRDWNSVAYGLVSGWFPAIALIIMFALLPRFLETLVKLRGIYTLSQIQRSVLKYYFWFLFVNVFLVSLLSGSTLQVLHQFADSTGFDVLNNLGKAIPGQSTFFINYILTYALFSYPLNILRIGPFIIAKLKKSRAGSVAERKDVEKPKDFKFELICGIQLIIFIISLAYTPIAPFILPWTVLFYAASYLFGKYMLIYIHDNEFDSGGLYWPIVFNRCVIGMFFAQIVYIAVFIFKTHISIVVVAPLPIFTLAFVYSVHKRFDAPSSHLPFSEYSKDSPNNGEIYRGIYADPFATLDTTIRMADPALLLYPKSNVAAHPQGNLIGEAAV